MESKWKRRNSIVIFAINIENLKTLKYHTFKKETLGLTILYSNCGHEYKRIFNEKESIEILKIRGLIINVEEYQKLYNNVWKKDKSRM